MRKLELSPADYLMLKAKLEQPAGVNEKLLTAIKRHSPEQINRSHEG